MGSLTKHPDNEGLNYDSWPSNGCSERNKLIENVVSYIVRVKSKQDSYILKGYVNLKEFLHVWVTQSS